MPGVTVVSDTTHYLPRELVAANEIREVSLYVNEGDQTTRESDMPDFDAFYERLVTTSELPTTSQPSIGDFLAVYEPLLDAGQDIVSVHMTGGISGTVESARQAADEAMQSRPGRRIDVIDSRSAAGGLGLVVLAAAAKATAGGDVDAVSERATAAVEHNRIWFAVQTLEFLRRGGRIGTAQAWLGGALQIKPILTVDHLIEPIERVRTWGRTFQRMVEYAHERKADGATAWAVQHIRAPEDAEKLVVEATEIFGHGPLFMSEVGPVLGTHAGPGMLGFAGIPPELVGP